MTKDSWVAIQLHGGHPENFSFWINNHGRWRIHSNQWVEAIDASVMPTAIVVYLPKRITNMPMFRLIVFPGMYTQYAMSQEMLLSKSLTPLWESTVSQSWAYMPTMGCAATCFQEDCDIKNQ